MVTIERIDWPDLPPEDRIGADYHEGQDYGFRVRLDSSGPWQYFWFYDEAKRDQFYEKQRKRLGAP